MHVRVCVCTCTHVCGGGRTISPYLCGKSDKEQWQSVQVGGVCREKHGQSEDAAFLL